MFDVKVSREDRLPLHDQVCAQIRLAIADGERLPPARDLAAVRSSRTAETLAVPVRRQRRGGRGCGFS
jgi:DNA-binding transcriptional regulator YhcF (GntR family)